MIVWWHYGRSGVHAALMQHRIELADNWLRRVHNVHQKNKRYPA